MPYTLNPTGFAALAISPGMLSEDAYIFLAPDSGVSGLLTAYLNYHSGNVKPLYSLRQTYSVLNGSGSPTSGVGYSGDLYINTADQTLWGPKTSDVLWPTGYVSLVGPAGSGISGVAGASGAVGQGVPASGLTNQALVKTSNTSYDTEWKDVIDIFNYPKANDLKNYKLIGRTGLSSPFNNIELDYGNSICVDPSDGTLLITSVSQLIIARYSKSGEFVKYIEFADLIGGTITSIKRIEGKEENMFAVLWNDGTTSPRIMFFVLPNFTQDNYHIRDIIPFRIGDEIDTGLPASLTLSAMCYNKRTESYYFCAKSSSTGVWNLYRYRGGSVTVALDLTTTRSYTGFGGATESVIHSIEFNTDNNTLIFLCDYDSSKILFQLAIDSDDNFVEITEASLDNPIDVIYLDFLNENLEDTTDFGFSFSPKDGEFYISDFTPFSTHFSRFSKSLNVRLFQDLYSNSLSASNGRSASSTITNKTYQSLDRAGYPAPTVSFSNTSNTSFTDTRGVGSKLGLGGLFSPGQTIKSEAYGKVEAFKNSSIFPSNYYSNEPLKPGGLTGSYYLSLPSGLNAPWKYTTEVVCKGFLTSGYDGPHTYRKVVLGHLEVFSSPKLELFYSETGSFSEEYSSDQSLTPAFKWAPSGSGTLTLHNSRTFFI
jgi:hypothetical protein